MVKQNDERLTCECPSGHRLRGPASLIGKQIECPRCKAEFIFGETYERRVTDTAVMRILGEMPPLDEMAETSLNTRPCARCGLATLATSPVCDHCKCYTGSLPDYLKTLGPRDSVGRG